jgi:hypothetical protein
MAMVVCQHGGMIDAGRKNRGHSLFPATILILAYCCLACVIGYDTIGWWAFVPTAFDPGSWLCPFLPFMLAYTWWKGGFKQKPPQP